MIGTYLYVGTFTTVHGVHVGTDVTTGWDPEGILIELADGSGEVYVTFGELLSIS